MLLETKALMRSWKFWFVLHVLRQDLKQGTFSISTLSKQIISQPMQYNLDKMCIKTKLSQILIHLLIKTHAHLFTLQSMRVVRKTCFQTLIKLPQNM